MQFNAFWFEFDTCSNLLRKRHQIDLKQKLQVLNCVELASAQFIRLSHTRKHFFKLFLAWGGLMNCVEANSTQFDAWSFRFKSIRRLLRKKFEQASNSTQKALNCGSNVVYGKFIPC